MAGAIGIKQTGAQLHEHPGNSRLPASDAADKADNLHAFLCPFVLVIGILRAQVKGY
jgi:hypothetical protein